MWDKYSTKEYEGLERFEDAISKDSDFNKAVASNQDLTDLTNIIGDTNRKLQMKYKREHTYQLELGQEQLYKEVMFDPRSKHSQYEEYRLNNPLRKVKNPRSIRNFTKTHERAKEVVEYP